MKFRGKLSALIIMFAFLAAIFFSVDIDASFAAQKRRTSHISRNSQDKKDRDGKNDKDSRKDKKDRRDRSEDKDKQDKHENNPKEKRAAQMKSIIKVFTEVNPKLSQSDAKNYAQYILEACRKFNQEPFAVAALIVHESTVNKNAVSKGGDYGLMQVRWSVHKKRISKDYPDLKHAKDLFKPRENILIGTEILSEYRGSGTLDAGIKRYSAGNNQLVRKVHGTMRKLEKYYERY